MPTATIVELLCVKPATGTDFGQISETLRRMTEPLKSLDVEGQVAFAILNSIPGFVQATDQIRADPDQLFLILKGSGNQRWPKDGSTVDMNKGQTVRPGITQSFDQSMSVTLFDHDLSSDDELGAISITKGDAGRGKIARRASSTIEGSLYWVTFKVTG